MAAKDRFLPRSNSSSSISSRSTSDLDFAEPPGPRSRTHRAFQQTKQFRNRINLIISQVSQCRHSTRLLWSTIFILFLTCLAIITWIALILTVVNRLRIPHLDNGLQTIIQTYHAPNVTHPAYPTWSKDFSAGVIPVQCHSHNDYWHRVPLYEGLAVGCVSTEADIWIGNTANGGVDLFVGHSSKSLTQTRTLRSLYLDPIIDILTQQNPNTTSDSPPNGVFTTSPNTSLILLLDFKTGDSATWNEVVTQLATLRAEDWITYWTPQTSLVQRPVTIVASGAAPFDLLIANTTYRDIFYDAPLLQLSSTDPPLYNKNNSFYASSSLLSAIGTVHFGRFSTHQKTKIEEQVRRAERLELQSRYWDTLSWPVGWRNRIWEQLVVAGVGTLNLDDLTAGARWDWQMCVVAGVNICNS